MDQTYVNIHQHFARQESSAAAAELIGYATVRSARNPKYNENNTDSSCTSGVSSNSYTSSGSTSDESGGCWFDSNISPSAVQMLKWYTASNLESLAWTFNSRATNTNTTTATTTRPTQANRRNSLTLKRYDSIVARSAKPGEAVESVESKISNLCNEPPAPPPPTDRSLQTISAPDEFATTNDNEQNQSQHHLRQNAPENPTNFRQALVIEERNLQEVVNNQSDNLSEADLVILPTKRVNQQQHGNLCAGKTQKQHKLSASGRWDDDDDRLSRCISRSRNLKQTNSSASSSASSSSSASRTSSASSSSSCISSYESDCRHFKNHLKKANSLSEDLESLISRSDYSNCCGDQQSKKTSKGIRNFQKISTSGRIDIDCVSPGYKIISAEERNHDEDLKSISAKTTDTTDNNDSTAITTSRSLFRSLFGSSNSSSPSSVAESSTGPNSSSSPPEATGLIHRKTSHLKISSIFPRIRQTKDGRFPTDGILSQSGLIDKSHATHGTVTSKQGRKSQSKYAASRQSNNELNSVNNYDSSIRSHSRQHLMLSSTAKYRSCYLPSGFSPEHKQEQQETLSVIEKRQSLSLYQSLLKNSASKRCHHNHSHHDRSNQNTHNHNHSKHHHHHHHRSNRHHRAHRSSSHFSSRCAQLSCGPNYQLGNENSRAEASRVSVWGQLVKINKYDGSQVIELERLPNGSWGFSMARGAIDNTKGIFISRMHDNATSESLAGLLSIGDQILAIDHCPIEPDHDTLRVNQMISKKSRISLKVKPFKL